MLARSSRNPLYKRNQMSNESVSLNTVVVAREDLLSSNLSDEELVMMDIDRGYYYGLENVAKAIWELLVQPRSIQFICENIVEEFDAEPDMVREDTLRFVGEMLDEKLIVIHTEGKAA